MKFLFTIVYLLSSLNSYASNSSICGANNSRLAWVDDVIVSQYECQNERTTVCASQAILLGDGIQYFVLAGERKMESSVEEIKSFILLPAFGISKFFEDNSSLKMEQSPKATFVENSKKMKISFSLDKLTGEALYTVESRDLFPATPWLVLVSEKLHCQNINEQKLIFLEQQLN